MLTKAMLSTTFAAVTLAAPAFAQVDFTLYDASIGGFFTNAPNGFTWGSMSDNVTESSSGLEIVATGGGGVGRNASATIDGAIYELQVTLRTLPANGATNFNVALKDQDGTGNVFDEYIYSMPVPAAGGFTTVTMPVGTPTEVRPGSGDNGSPGDGVMNFGLSQWQIQTAGEETLAVEVQHIELVQVEESNVIPVLDLGADANPLYDGGSLDVATDPNAWELTDDSLIINGVSEWGNIGWSRNIDLGSWEEWQLSVVARSLPEATADYFAVVLIDDDGDDSEEGTGAEEFFYAVGFGELNNETFTQVDIPLDDWISRQQAYDPFFDGDMIPNYGLYQLQIQAPGGAVVAVEVDEIFFSRIDDTAPPCPADWNEDEAVNVQDLLAYLGAFRTGDADMNDDDVTNVQDLLAYLNAFRAGCPA